MQISQLSTHRGCRRYRKQSEVIVERGLDFEGRKKVTSLSVVIEERGIGDLVNIIEDLLYHAAVDKV